MIDYIYKKTQSPMEENLISESKEIVNDSLVVGVTSYPTVKPKISKLNWESGEGNGDESADGDN